LVLGKKRRSIEDQIARLFGRGTPWEYWNFSGGLDGDLVVEYRYGGTGFIGSLNDAIVEESS
jgi:hypothetical protein